MTTASVLTLAFCLGLVAGLRSVTAPAAVSWRALLHWLDLQHSSLSFLGSSVAAYALAVFAIGELIVDKLPMTPSRTKPPSLIFRLLTGGLSGAALCSAR